MSRRRSGRHPKVDLLGGIFRGGALARRCHRFGDGRRARDQAEFSCLGDSLGAVGCAELAEDVADVLLTVSRVTTSSPAKAWFGVTPSCQPASAEDSTRHVHLRVMLRPGDRS